VKNLTFYIILLFVVSCGTTPTSIVQSSYECKTPNELYPKDALEHCIEGHVKIQFDVDENGKTTNVIALESLPKGVFDNAGVEVIKNWEYKKNNPFKGKKVQLDFTLEKVSNKSE